MTTPLPEDRSEARPLLGGLLGLAAGAVLLAGQPGGWGDPVFSTGFALRAVLFALVGAGALFAAWAGPGTRPALGSLRAVWLALPIGVALLALPAADGTWSGAARHGATWVLMGLWPLALLWTWRGPDEPAWLLRVLVTAGALAAAPALLAALGGKPGVGPFGRAGVAGPVFGALVAPALFFSPWRTRLLRYVPALLLLAACLLTRSRTGIAAALLGTALALALGVSHAARRRRLRMVTTALSLGLVIALALVVEGALPAPGTRRTLDVRLGLHRASLSSIGERPLRGHGLGSFPVQAIEHRDLQEARLEPRRRAFHAHNDYLHAGVEGGWPAGLLLLAFLGGLGLFALRAAGGERRLHAAAAGMVGTLGVAALGDGVLVDPAPALLLGCAAAVLLRPAVGRRRAAGVLSQAPLVMGAFLLLGIAFVLAKDALADRSLMRYRAAIAGAVSPAAAERAAQQHLVEGALHWRADHPEGLYRLAVHEASSGQAARARETYRAALRADPGMTEARLDLAQIYGLEGRPGDARDVLAEARHVDPTRYDVPRRMFDLVLGPEPVPGDRPGPFDEVEALRWMNEARALAPERFENELDEARFARRRGDLERAGARVRAALAKVPGDPQDPPAEVLLESFRLAEQEDSASDLFKASILLGAFLKNPRPAKRFGVEAERFLRIGLEREQRIEAERGAGQRADFRPAERAYAAAAIRLTALLYAQQLDPEQVLRAARDARTAGHWRAALARYRSLLAWTLPPQRGSKRVSRFEASGRLEELARQGDLLLEAASVAHHVDQALAAFYRTRGQVRIGIELLAKDDAAMAEIRLRSALKSDPNFADAHFGLSRALARQGVEDAAEAALLEALRLNPDLRGPALVEPDLESLRARTAVRTRLGLP